LASTQIILAQFGIFLDQLWCHETPKVAPRGATDARRASFPIVRFFNGAVDNTFDPEDEVMET
jgi:hypothetical protein